jgi:hypothetical protein
MSIADRIREDVAKARERFPNVTSLTHDGELIGFIVTGKQFSVVLPETYGCSCDVYGPDDIEFSCSGSVVDIIDSVLKQLDGGSPGAGEATPHTMNSETASFPMSDIDEEILDSMRCEVSTKFLSRMEPEISALRKHHGISCSYDVISSDGVFVTLFLPIDTCISRSTAEAWGFARDKPLCISLSVNEAHYIRTANQLEVRFWQERNTSGYVELDAGVQLSSIIKNFWWQICGVEVAGPPADGHTSNRFKLLSEKKSVMSNRASVHQGVLLPLALYIADRLPCLHEYCVICDEPLVFPPLLRPTVCTRTLCCFRLRAFGSAITGEYSSQNASLEIWDLLVAMAICAHPI